jgi:bifunctional non-homologous end joining protein LigD
MTEEIGVGGITVELSHPGKVLFPDDGITKHDLAAYYADVADPMLSWLRDRPITMARYPDGIGAQRIFQKNVPAYFPRWIRRVQVPRVEVKTDSATVEHAICRADRVDRPDQLVIDFDPPDGQHFAEARRAALAARDLLDGELGLTSYVRTTGGRGLHVHVVLDRRAGFKPVLEFAHAVAGLLARRHPDLITAEQRKDKRGSLVYADVMRNAYAQTVVASYGVRARPGAPVATPLSWAEVTDDGLDPSAFTIATTRARLDRQGAGGGPWADFPGKRHGLGEAARRLARLSSPD